MRWKARLSGWLALYPEDDPMAPVFRARQIHAALRITPLTMVANLLNALLVGATFWDDVDRWLLGAWVLLVALFVTQGLRAWWRHPSRPTASRHAINRSTMQAALLALAWGVLIVTLIPGASSAQQLLLAIVASGMMSAGGLALATLPMAGTVWVLIFALASFYALIAARFALVAPVGGLLLIYCVILISSVWATARAFASRLLAESKAEQQHQIIGLLLREFEENANDVLWETDARGYLTRITSRLQAALGLPAEKLTAAPLASLLATQQGGLSSDDHLSLATLRDRLSQQAPFRDVVVPVFTGGQKMWWSLTAKPQFDNHGRQSGWRGVASNVSERVLAQEALRTQHERLEVLVQERTTKLNQALNAAEAANRAKSLFLSSMSHELRTPLNAVLGYSQLMRMNKEASAETLTSAAEIESAGKHLLALVNDILDLARIESGKLEVHIENVELSGVLAESRRTLASLAQGHGVTLEIPDLSALLKADPLRLRQVMFNLLSNAIKYNRAGGRVSVHGEPRPEQRYRITVRDTGHGIATHRMGELFQPFNRMGAEHGTIEGTGIGLVITKTLVEAMDGRIGAESVAGQGSAFWFELPLADGTSQPA